MRPPQHSVHRQIKPADDDLHCHRSFKTALVTYEEHLVLEDLFGQPDIVAPNLEELARQIIAAERRA